MKRSYRPRRSAGLRYASSALFLALCSLSLTSFLSHPTVLGANSWGATGGMHVPRSHFTTTLLRTGQVLVAGGEIQDGGTLRVTASAELYDPSSGSWSQVSSMSTPRMDFTATRLPDGRVLVVGGSNGVTYLSSTELFDPSTTTWSRGPAMVVARSNHTSNLLQDGRVFVAGGFGVGGALSSAEVYDPAANTWTIAEDMRVARGNHTATVLPSGQVLVTGGSGAIGPLNSVELFDPGNARWVGFQPLPTLAHPRYNHTATLLPDGRVLVVGGFDSQGPLRSTELYDPTTHQWTSGPSMNVARALHTATLLGNGQVLVTGGQTLPGSGSLYTNTAELYDPAGNTWIQTASMQTAREAHTATLLANGPVLVAGGSAGAMFLSEAELYTPAIIPPTATSPVVSGTSSPLATPTIPLPPSVIPTRTQPTPMATPATPPPTGPVFSIRAVRVETYGSKPDWRLVRSPLKRVRAGRQVRLSIYTGFTGVTGKSHVAVAAEVRHRGVVVFTAGLTEDRASNGNLWDHWRYTAGSTGKYVLVGRVTVDGEMQQVRFSFTALPARPSFSFERLETVNDRGHISHIFVRSERIHIVATITVHNAAGTVRATVGQQLQHSTAAGWRSLGRRVENAFPASNGTHSYIVIFYPQTPYSLLRMVIDVRIGSQTQRKSVTFEVRA